MIRITKESEYAFLLLSALLDEDDVPKSATKLAEQTGIAAPMTGKVLKRLVKNNILASTRGAYGGYTLTREPQAVSVLEVVEAMEGAPELWIVSREEVTVLLPSAAVSVPSGSLSIMTSATCSPARRCLTCSGTNGRRVAYPEKS